MPSNSNKVYLDIKDSIQTQIDNSIDKNLATAGTITKLTQGSGISFSSATITKEGTISLNADLNHINGVSIDVDSLAVDHIFAWNGTSWINKAFPGLSGTSFSLVDLVDVEISGGLLAAKNDLLVVNNQGTCIINITNDYINTVQALTGIASNKIDNRVSLEFDPSTISTESNLNSEDRIVFQRTGIGARTIRLDDIDISKLNDDLEILTNNNITAGTAIEITKSGISTTIGICTLELPLDFNAGVCGILKIENGGTSGSTSASARDYLGLEYNRDILIVSGPSFTGTMFGDNISLLPSSFGLSLITGGSGYTNGDNIILVNPDTNAQIDLGITFTTSSGGVITGPTSGSVSIRNLNLLDRVETYAVYDGSATGASFSLTPDPFYLFFGGSTNATSVGLRDYRGELQVKSKHSGKGSSWRTFFPLGLDGLSDAAVSNPEDGHLLVYEGTSFINAPLTGTARFSTDLTYNGTSLVLDIRALNEAISLSNIEGGVSKAEFQTLVGIDTSETIKEQLAGKIGVCPGGVQPADGDLVYYNSNDWKLLRHDGTSGKILGVSNHLDIPTYNHLYDFTVNTASYDWANDGFIFVKENEQAYNVSLSDYLEANIAKNNGGLSVDAPSQKLEIDLVNLLNNTGSEPNDLFLLHNTTQSESRKITKTNLLSSFNGSGLSVISDKLAIYTEGVSALSLKTYTDGSSILNQAPASSHNNSLAAVGSSLVFSNGTSWYYVNLGNYIS